MNDNMIYVFIAFGAYMALKKYSSYKVLQLVPGLLKNGGQIVDVRSVAEFVGGHKEGSINMPLDTLKTRMDELDTSKPVILCCASGTRSGMAKRAFIAKGFQHVYNAGTWRSLTRI